MKTIAYLFLLLVLICAPAYAETTETEPEHVELTTYYPAPYGEYDELSANRVTADGVTYVPLTGSPESGHLDSWPADEKGTVRYSASNDDLYYFNGSEWMTTWAGAGSSGPTIYTAWGMTICPDDGIPLYSGYVTSGMTNQTGSALVAGGGFICLPSLPGYVNYGSALTQNLTQGSSDGKVHYSADRQPCVVCKTK